MSLLKDQIEEIAQSFDKAIAAVASSDQLEKIRITFLARNGQLAELMERFKSVSLEEKRIYGPLLNDLKKKLHEQYESTKIRLENARGDQEAGIDFTAYRYEPLKPTLHPYTKMIAQIEDIFISMGYRIADGPEVEHDYYNFQALNIPADHPARDMQDTFWLNQTNMLLRTHTSSVEVHCMEEGKLPLAVCSIGRVYRNEEIDATHSFMFTQVEALCIDENISMGNLLATAKTFLQLLFNRSDITIRVRPSYYPFVEPGVDIDASCPFCNQKGCSFCKKTGWIELLGAGMTHPRVLEMSGIDSKKYAGFAFGMGLERLIMIKHNINDIRLFHSAKIPFLDQW